MKITKNALLFTATLVLVVFSGCSTPEQTRATSPQPINSAIAAEQSIPSPSVNSSIEPNAPQINPTTIETLNCEDAITQAEMNICTANEAREANEKLNEVYKKLQEKVQGTPQEARLIKAQRAWVAFRDADCEYSQRRYDGGSIMSAIYALCVVDLTEKRTQRLEEYLEQG